MVTTTMLVKTDTNYQLRLYSMKTTPLPACAPSSCSRFSAPEPDCRVVVVWLQAQAGPDRDEAPLKGWSQVPSLNLLNLRYDLTPMKYVNLVITEVGMIPPTSVPVLIRESRKDEVALNLDL